jgi:hypothetical protein
VRVGHYIAAYANIPFGRTINFLVGWVASMYIGFLICAKASTTMLTDPTEEGKMMLVFLCIFTLFQFIPYDVGRIPANGIKNLTYYHNGVSEELWTKRGLHAHQHMSGETLPFLIAIMIIASDLPIAPTKITIMKVIVGFRVLHYIIAYRYENAVPIFRTCCSLFAIAAALKLAFECMSPMEFTMKDMVPLALKPYAMPMKVIGIQLFAFGLTFAVPRIAESLPGTKVAVDDEDTEEGLLTSDYD